MLSYLLKATLCWSLFYLLYHLWLGKETFFKTNRWYLIGTAILGTLIPLVDFQLLIAVQEEPVIVHYLQPISVGVDQLEAVIVTASAEEANFNWWGILIKMYWLGAAVSFVRFLYGLFKINKLYNEGEKSEFNNYQFILTPVFHAPFSFFKNLFWSKDFEVDEEDKKNILRHEEAHIFQWHSVDVILFEILSIAFWCSPFIYFYKEAIKNTHEYLADDYVVANASRKKYGQLLLRQSQSGMPIAISNSFFSSQLKNRIVMMTKNRSNRKASLKYLAGLPLLALLFLAFSQSGQFQEKNQTTEFGKIINKKGLVSEWLQAHMELRENGSYENLTLPQFPGDKGEPKIKEEKKCIDYPNKNLKAFINKHLKYPKGALEKKMSGMVMGHFFVEPDGSITDATVAKSIGGGCEEEVLRVISLMPKFTPAMRDGKPIRHMVFLPVHFNLNGPIEDKIMVTGNETDTLPDGEVFKVVEEMPAFFGCAEIIDKTERKKCSDENMLNYIFKNLKYPKEAKEKGIEGMIVASFIIEKDGSVTSAKIIRSIGGGCDEEVLRIVNAMPNWTPGKQGGKDVRVQFNLPVRFKMDDNETEKEHTESKAISNTGNSEEIFKVVEEMPRFPGCEEITNEQERTQCWQTKMLEFIFSNIKYPASAREKGIEGMAVVQFVVEKDGSIADAEIIRSIGGECDEEVLKVVYMMPNWIPGKQNGKIVRTQFNLPVKFKLEGEAKKIDAIKIDDVHELPYMIACKTAKKVERKKCSDEAMLQFIYKNVKYPKEAQEKKVEGMIIAKFIIDKNGQVINPEIVRSLGAGCDEEVKRVIGLMPDWEPGYKDGKPVAVEFNLPVKFKLQGSDKTINVDESKLNDSPTILKAFPNPATDKLSIEFKSLPGNYKMALTDINGKTYPVQGIKGHTGKMHNIIDFPVKDFPRGTLFISVKNEKGKTIETAAVVLQ